MKDERFQEEVDRLSDVLQGKTRKIGNPHRCLVCGPCSMCGVHGIDVTYPLTFCNECWHAMGWRSKNER